MPATNVIETEVASLQVVIGPGRGAMDVSIDKEKSSLAVDIGAKDKMGISGMAPSIAKDYNKLFNKPLINEVELIGNKTGKQLGLQDKMESLTNLELDDLIQF